MNYKKVMAVGLILLLPILVRAEVSQVVFTTEPQNIAPGTNSGTLTVQTQNSSGVKENIPETADLTFISTSATGEFLSTSGNSITTTMSKNSANRNFLYRDSTPGSYQLTVVVTGRTTGQSWRATQPITVSREALSVPATSLANTDNESGTDEEPVGVENVGGSLNSSHQSQVGLSTGSEKLIFTISIGRRRQVAVGTAVPFWVQLTGGKKDLDLDYNWSFGDGSSAEGAKVEHVYVLPGSYNVVATAHSSQAEAVARTTINVVTPLLGVSTGQAGEQAYVAIKNNSPYEVNLGHWRLAGGVERIILPADTIINGNSELKLPTNIAAKPLVLEAPDGRIYARTFPTEEQDRLKLLAALRALAPAPVVPSEELSLVSEPVTMESPPAASVVELPVELPWWQKLWHEIF